MSDLREKNEALVTFSVQMHELAQQAEQAQAVLRSQKEALEMVAGTSPLADVLDFLARAVESHSPAGMMAAIHLLNPEGTQFASAAAPSLPAEYAEATQGMAVDSNAGPCCEAVLSGQMVVVADVARDGRWPRFAEFALPCGISAGWSTPILSSAGRVVGTVAVYYRQPLEPAAQDIAVVDVLVRTAALAIERDRAQSDQARLAAIVTYSEDAIVSKDLGGTIITWNRGAERLFGYTADEAVGRSITMLIPEDHLDEEPEILARIRAGGLIDHFETVRRRKDGSLVEISLTISPIRDAAGRIIGASKVARDITERRRAQLALKEHAKALADLHRRKDEFLAMLSHELRNPLAPIMNAVQLLRHQQGNSEVQKEAHGMIERQVGHLARLVDDLLEVSRITTGRIHLQLERIDLRGIVERAISAMQPQCGQKAQTLAVWLPPEPVWINGDGVRLEQVVMNLLNNACKYTDTRGHIWVGLEQQGDEAELRVRDNGSGIAPELLPRIFDLFTQADRTLDRSQGGLGVGLALVHSLVAMHRGRVEARSKLGEGSEFVVRLPVMAPSHATAEADAPLVESPSKSLRVMVVDDNVDAARGLSLLLGIYGHEVRVVYDGAAAVQAALEFVPDVVLLDLGLPVNDGYQVAKWIRDEAALENVTLVAVTGYGQESDRRRTREAGFDEHLVKPVDFDEVQRILAAAERV
jgi:PAS domain S-box-containing protein